jgi:hypothetical protein
MKTLPIIFEALSELERTNETIISSSITFIFAHRQNILSSEGKNLLHSRTADEIKKSILVALYSTPTYRDWR